MKVAFVIGNGPSRSVFDISKLTDVGVTYGCNLLIQDIQIDNTIVCDRAVLVHLLSQRAVDYTNLWTRPSNVASIFEDKLKPLPDPITNPKLRWDKSSQWGSGTHAVHLAASQNADIVVMIGFDLWPRSDGFNNVYQNVPEFYNSKVIDPACWIYQLKCCFLKYPDIDFVQIQPKSWKKPVEWDSIDNYSQDDYAGLKKWIKTL